MSWGPPALIPSDPPAGQRREVRLEHLGRDRAQAIGYYPQEGTYYLSGEGDRDEGTIKYVDESGKQWADAP